MLLTLTCVAPDAPRFGYLLGKHPDAVFARPFSMGRVIVFYPRVAEDSLTIALLVELDPVGLVRRPVPFAGLDQYVNDRPYVASSFTSVALSTAFSTALAGRCPGHPELVEERAQWSVTLPTVACDAGAELIARVFEPLGYSVATTQLPLDARFPTWGGADLYAVRLEGHQTCPDLLRHLYILLPVLDNTKHYYVAEDEIQKLMDHGSGWLAAHPERELITRRYLRYSRPLVASALARLAPLEEAAPDDPMPGEVAAGAIPIAAGSATPPETAAPTSALTSSTTTDEHALGLHEQRLRAVMETIRHVGAHSLVDLGCGEGRLLELALREPALTSILGIDVSTTALTRARRRLRLDAPALPARLRIEHGSLLYRDERLCGFDAAALVEVIEHLDPPRLAAMEAVVFGSARPRWVVITTPNREYNARWAALPAGKLRHSDHRFEWTRAEGQAWAARVADAYGYRSVASELGPEDPEVGAPSQMLVFDRHN